MARISYEQARADHEYLWAIAPPNDMTGGYVDQDDLAKLLRNPTKGTARDLYCDQIQYWFAVGPDVKSHGSDWRDYADDMVVEIADRHGINEP